MATHCVTDEGHFFHLLESERPRLVRLCAYLVNDPNVGEDLAQEVLIEAWQHLASLRDPLAVNGWLTGIARNVSARWRRARQRDRTSFVKPTDGLEMAQQPSHASDLDLVLERHELATLLDRSLALLPEATRTILIQKYIAESSHAAIAEQLGLSENAITVRLHRGKLALHKLLTTELRDEAEAFGLVASESLQETRIWCSSCGQQRLRGKLDDTEFILRCPTCNSDPGSFHSQSSATSVLGGIKTFRPALTCFSTWMDSFFQLTITQGFTNCQRCGRPMQLHLNLPDHVPPSIRGRRGLHVLCTYCGTGSYESVDGLALNLPQGRRFWRAHPRIRTLPQREVELNGVPAILVPFESVDRQATLDVLLQRDTYRVLETREGAHG